MVTDMFKRYRLPLALLVVAGVVAALFAIRSEQAAGYTIPRVVQYGFEIRNQGNRVAKGVEFWAYAPVKLTSTQRLEKLSVSYPYELIEDGLGNQIIHIRFETIPPFATKLVDIQAEFALSDVPNPLALKNRHDFLKAEKFVEADNSEIRNAAAPFSGGDLSDLEAMYAWTANHIHGKEYVRENRGALFTLQNKSGDCTEYAYLFTALSRVNGVPARPLGGYVLEESGKLSADAYHNWAEFYQDGKWQLADPQMKVFLERPSRFIAMNIMSASEENPMMGMQRFRFTGDNIFVTMR